MTNFQIITDSAIATGLYTEERAIEIIQTEGELPLHTFAEWKRLGYSIRKGEHAKLVCFIWRHKSKTKEVQQDDKTVEINESSFYKTKAHFFDNTQVEKIPA